MGSGKALVPQEVLAPGSGPWCPQRPWHLRRPCSSVARPHLCWGGCVGAGPVCQGYAQAATFLGEVGRRNFPGHQSLRPIWVLPLAGAVCPLPTFAPGCDFPICGVIGGNDSGHGKETFSSSASQSADTRDLQVGTLVVPTL